MSGWGNQSGVLYQQARAVLTCLSMLDGGQPDLFAVHVESRQDLFDLELLDNSLNVTAAVQIKNRQLDNVWTPSDIYPLLVEWAGLPERPPGGLELLLGGRLGPAGLKLQQALRSAHDGDLTSLRDLAGGRLSSVQLEAASSVRLVVDPTQVASLMTAGIQQGMALLPDPRTGADARAEADAVLGSLNLLVQRRASLSEASERVVTRLEVAELFGIDPQGFTDVWDASLRSDYRERVLSLGEPKTVSEDVRGQVSPIQRAAGYSDGQATQLADLLTRREHILLSGHSGTGKSTAAVKLRYEACIVDKLVVIANAEAFIPGRLAALLSNGLATVLNRPIGLAAGRAILADPSVTVVFDGASEMTVDQRRSFVDELASRIQSPSACRAILVGRDPSVLNSLLPREVSRSAFVLRGILADQRERLVLETLTLKGLPTADASGISARAAHALKDAASVPYLLAMAAELISYGFDITSRAQMYYAFTEQMAERQGILRLQFCTLALGVAFSELLDGGRRQCDQFEWAQLLAKSSRSLALAGVHMDADEIESTARRGGFVSYENYDQTVRPVHDSVADYFSALAMSKELTSIPPTVTENDALRLRFLAELVGVSQPLAHLVTSDIPFAGVEISQFDRSSISADTPASVRQLVQNVLAGTAVPPPSVQIGSTADERVFIFRNVGDSCRLLDPPDVAQLILRQGARETRPGALQIAVTLWRQILEEFLQPDRVSGRIPATESEAIAAVKDHSEETESAVRSLVAQIFPPACHAHLLQLAVPEPLDVAIRPAGRAEEPYWPMIWRSSDVWKIRAVEFETWKADGEHSGWGSVDSIVRKSPTDTAKESVVKAVNELVDMPWLN